MQLTPEALQQFTDDVIKRYPEEACGFIVSGQYIPTPNSSATPTQTFRIDPIHYVKASSFGKVEAVLHSHPYGKHQRLTHPAEWPSTADMTAWMAGGIPWGICATNGEGITQLVWLDENNPEPLVGRQFIHGINDCYSLIRDWYKLERGIVLPNFARGMEWWDHGEDLYDQNFHAAGFDVIPLDQATVGDCVLFQVRSPVTNHAAVITGENEILHHLFHRLSGHDTLAKWGRVINKAVRFRG